MPTAYIANIGPVEYTRSRLPSGVKGQSYIGGLYDPILITEDLSPGTKLDYIVAHEVGHRLTLDMLSNAAEEMPEFFREVPRAKPTAGLIKYFMLLGLTKDDLKPLHPGTLAATDRIFAENLEGRWTNELEAREFVAEVYANWATNTGHTPPAIAKRFQALTKSKNLLLGKLQPTDVAMKGELAAFDVMNESDYRTAFLFLLALGVISQIL